MQQKKKKRNEKIKGATRSENRHEEGKEDRNSKLVKP